MPDGTDGSVPIPPDEVAGSLAARRALGEEAEAGVIAAFLERTGQAIDARVDARLAAYRTPAPAPERRRGDAAGFWLALCSIVLAVPLTAIATQFPSVVALVVIIVSWTGIVAVNVSYRRR